MGRGSKLTFVDHFLLKVRRAEAQPYRFLKSLAKAILSANIPYPRFLSPIFRFFYGFHYAVCTFFRWLATIFYFSPLFRSKCDSVGKNLRLEQLPHVTGHPRIRIGDDVWISGALDIAGGRTLDTPELNIGNGVFIGHRSVFHVSREIIVEDGVLIAQGCYIADSDGHPKDMVRRIQGEVPSADEIRPVRICRNAWLGRGAVVVKGITIGEGAIVGAGSIVSRDVPPYSVVAGNPARLVRSNDVQNDIATVTLKAEEARIAMELPVDRS